jgi:hypothetical protein
MRCKLFCAHACRLLLSHTCLPCSAALRLLPFFACGLLCGYAFHGGWLCACMFMVNLSCARCSGECCLSTCMHGWQLPAGCKHGCMHIKEGALQTILLTATHAKFMFSKVLRGCRSLGFASKLCALGKFQGCTRRRCQVGAGSKHVSCQAL